MLIFRILCLRWILKNLQKILVFGGIIRNIISLLWGQVSNHENTHAHNTYTHRWLKTVGEYGVCLLRGIPRTTQGGLQVRCTLYKYSTSMVTHYINIDCQESVTSPARNLLWRGKSSRQPHTQTVVYSTILIVEAQVLKTLVKLTHSQGV